MLRSAVFCAEHEALCGISVGGWEAAGTAWSGSSPCKNYFGLSGAFFSLAFHFVVVSFTVGSKICFEAVVLKV
jgi:hypothetical protein